MVGDLGSNHSCSRLVYVSLRKSSRLVRDGSFNFMTKNNVETFKHQHDGDDMPSRNNLLYYCVSVSFEKTRSCVRAAS